MNNKFKLEYYFAIYKDKCLPNRDTFRKNFKKKHGKFQYLEELIVKIEKYQLKKYGCTLNNDKLYYSKNTEQCRKDAKREQSRTYNWRKRNVQETK